MGKRIVGYIYWLLPAYLLFQTVYQVQVLRGLEMTYGKGESYVADVVDFRLKNMQAQSNGIIELKFDINSGETVQKRMTLPVQIAAITRQYGKIPVRYLADSPQPIVMIPTYDFHHNMVRINVAILASSLLATLIMGYFVLRWSRRIRDEADLKFERIDV